MKVITLVGTRPEIIRLSSIIKNLEYNCDHTLVHTGQNYDPELIDVFFEDLGLNNPKHYLGAAGENAAITISNVIRKFDEILQTEQPDAFLVLGDTNSAFGAICAKKRKIPIFHYEAGNRCFDENVPEETNRRIIDHIADINLTYSQIAKANLLNEGQRADRVICIGSPMNEVISANKDRIEASKILSKLELSEGQYFVLSAHREENVEDPNFLYNLLSASEKISMDFGIRCVFSVHPRTQKRLLEYNEFTESKQISFLKPFGFTDYCKLQKSSIFVASDSGTLSEESSILGFSAINLRTTHERQEMNEFSPLIMTGRTYEGILQGMEIAMKKPALPLKVPDYQRSNISDKIFNIILSYTQYVNYYVLRK